MKSKVQLLSICITTFLLVLVSVARSDAQPTSVLVYNQAPDGFNNNAEGNVWKELGFLDSEGRPGTIRPNADIVDGAETKLGSAERHMGVHAGLFFPHLAGIILDRVN
jgi:hypothetical protein